MLIIDTYGEDCTPNAMNAARDGIYDTNQITVFSAGDHKTTYNRNLGEKMGRAFADGRSIR